MKALLLAASLLVLPGCVLVAGAAVGAGIVYTTGEDTVEVRVDSNAAAAFAVAREEILLRGMVDSADGSAGTLEGRIGNSTVKVTVTGDPDGAHSRVAVKARSAAGLSPDEETARTLAVAVVRRVR